MPPAQTATLIRTGSGVRSSRPGPIAATAAVHTLPIVRPLSMRMEEEAERKVRSASSRAVNVLVAFLLLVLTAPLMLLIAVAVKLSSPGPILYSQERVGLDQRRRQRRRGPRRFEGCRRQRDMGGRIFRIYKFRTMRVAGDDAPQVWASKDDPRITPIGKFLRAHRLDELPQLFNVLRGDMNLVGPRPEQPRIFEEIRESIRHYPARQSVRPGITGWAQVNHKYDEDLNDVKRKLQFDLEYVQRQSVTKDLLIMAKTPQVMLFKQGSQ